MIPTMCFLCCAVAILSIFSCNAQLTPLLLPLTPLKPPLAPGLLAMPAARLAATNAAFNVLSQGAKLPKTPIGKPIGLSLAAKAIKPVRLPIVPPLKPLKSTKLGKTTLLKSKVPKKVSSVRLRSIDDEEGAEYLESLKSDEQSDTFPDGTISQMYADSSNADSNENSSDHLYKPRSPDNIESVDEFDYLTKAANPADVQESGFKKFVHKVEHGIANTFKKIDETFRPHSKKPDDGKDIVSSPYLYNNQNERIIIDNKAMEEYMRGLNTEQGLILNYPYTTESIESVRNALNEFQQRASSMRNNPIDEDALSKISQNNGAIAIEDLQKLMSEYIVDSTGAVKSANNSVGEGRYNQQQMDYPYYISTNGLEYNPEYDGIWNPYADVMSKMANTYFGNGYSFDQYPSPYESGLYQAAQVPSESTSSLYKRDSPSEDLPATTIEPTLTRNSRQMSPWNFQGMPAGSIVNSALGLSEGIMSGDYGKISQAGVNLGSGIASTANGNPQQMSPMSFGGMPAGGIVNSALGLSEGIMSGDYNKISQAGVNLGSGIASTANGNPQQISPMSFGGMPAGGIVNSALDLSQGIMKGDYDKISQAGVNLGTGIASTANGNYNPENYKYGGLPSTSQGLWNSANDLAGSITNAAKNPNNIGTDQVFGSIDKIWNSANNLAGNIGKDASGNLKNSPLSSLMKNKYASSAQDTAGNIYKSASDLASSITNVAKNPTQVYNTLSNPLSSLSKDRPIGSIYNSANNLAQNIAKSTGNLGNQAKVGTLNQLMKLKAAANQATGLAGNLANSAVNKGTSGLNQLMGYNRNSGLNQLFGYNPYPNNYMNSNSYPAVAKSGIDMAKQIVGVATGYPSMQNYFGGPTYGGGYYPRNSQADNIWNSANSLASNIYDAGKYPSMAGNQPFNSFYNPFNSIWGSATNLAQGITNAAMFNRMGGMPQYYY